MYEALHDLRVYMGLNAGSLHSADAGALRDASATKAQQIATIEQLIAGFAGRAVVRKQVAEVRRCASSDQEAAETRAGIAGRDAGIIVDRRCSDRC